MTIGIEAGPFDLASFVNVRGSTAPQIGNGRRMATDVIKAFIIIRHHRYVDRTRLPF